MKAIVKVETQVEVELNSLDNLDDSINEKLKELGLENNKVTIDKIIDNDNVSLSKTYSIEKNKMVWYKPLCPRGYSDCILDPAYKKASSTERFKELHGDKTPEEVLYEEDGCIQRVKEDPDEEYYCYDDEEK